VYARFQRAVERRAACLVARLVERVNFGMRLARALVAALPDDNAFIRDDARADHRIRSGAAESPLGELQSPPHPVVVLA
jgi:hypothetical protein